MTSKARPSEVVASISFVPSSSINVRNGLLPPAFGAKEQRQNEVHVPENGARSISPRSDPRNETRTRYSERLTPSWPQGTLKDKQASSAAKRRTLAKKARVRSHGSDWAEKKRKFSNIEAYRSGCQIRSLPVSEGLSHAAALTALRVFPPVCWSTRQQSDSVRLWRLLLLALVQAANRKTTEGTRDS